jgi:Domain of Unknown Function (DUF1080)
MLKHLFILVAGVLMFSNSCQSQQKPSPIGYKDTPLIPGTSWHVHDSDRPRPRVVAPGATFSHNAGAPSDAIVLFDGKDLSKWRNDKGADAAWKVENGYMEVVPKAGNIFTREEFGDFQLHFEFATPAVVKGNSQGRGNSGVFLHGIYEVQVLDSYENITYADGQLGGIYGQFPPLANPAKKPGEWSSYDVIFEGPRFDAEGKITRKASVTVIVNGVVLQHKKEYMGSTKHKEVADYNNVKKTRGPIGLQDHGDLMRFRNMWLRPLGEMDKP